MRRTRSFLLRALVAVPAAVVVTGLATVLTAPVAGAGDSTGFYFGTDSNGPTVHGSYPYQEPGTGGLFGGYAGEIGTWTNWRGCTSGTAFDATDARAVNADESASSTIPGLSFYWFMAGPGADPRYNGTYAEAYDWGRAQAERVEADYSSLAGRGLATAAHHVPLMFMDIEGQPTPGYANGWNEIVNSCGRITRSAVIPSRVDRATFNGFYEYVHVDTIFRPGVYSTPDFWAETFGTGSSSRIPNTYEWTPVTSTGRTTPSPVGFRQGADVAHWFGGIHASREAAWQWTQNGGDFDQFETAHQP